MDELTTYMKQRLLDYNGDNINRRQARAQTNRHNRLGPMSEDRTNAEQVTTKAIKQKRYGQSHQNLHPNEHPANGPTKA